MESKEERKSKLRDWMTATTQLVKINAQDQKVSVSDITYWWRGKIGVKMTDEWIKKALYGNKGKP